MADFVFHESASSCRTERRSHDMRRREFLRVTGLAACAASCSAWLGAESGDPNPAHSIELAIHTEQRLGRISPDFMGLGYEISSVATPGLLSARNRTYVQLVRRLSTRGVMRVGGNTSDYSSYAPDAKPVSTPKGTVIDYAGLRDLGGFLEATGWSLIWGLNLGNGSVADAVIEAQAVTRAVGKRLLAFEIGNEPTLYTREGHRSQYSYEAYLSDYRRYKAAVRAALPQAAFAGPDATGANDWVTPFAAQEGSDLRLLTHHYYREGQKPTSTMDKLLRPDPRLPAMLDRMQAASASAGIPYRICETNSFSGGGRPGVSDTYGAALWALDYLCVLAWHGAGGVNMETGINQLDFISSYSPIADDRQGHYHAAPDYYGMLAFAQIQSGERVATSYDAGAINLTAYAVVDEQAQPTVVIVNKDAALDAEARIALDHPATHARVMRLNGPALDSKTGVTLGGAPVTADGRWSGRFTPAPIAGGTCVVRVPASSAAIVALHR